ncbi:cytochrome c oxidase assembly protein [Ilumatobacter sp.]|uniref:cytochrome c oxidase assembly protein n=1 Tax=Ilumatobacter sp. TaxID=1967498 RepID=UPI003B525156
MIAAVGLDVATSALSAAVRPASALLAHDGAPVRPHDALRAWDLDPSVVAPLAVVAWLHHRGRRPGRDGAGRDVALVAALVIVAIALLSPIDAVAGVLLSAHMVQHVLLVTVAAPLLAWAAPGAALLRGTPVAIRRRLVRTRRSSGLHHRRLVRLRHPALRWLALVVVLWVWHASSLYSLAIRDGRAHALEHASFLGAAFLFWTVIIGPSRMRLEPGFAILAVFTLTLQGIVLSMLMTFSRLVWYEPYRVEASGWGLDPLTDQQLAGVIMWVPTGFVHTGITLALLFRWLAALDRDGERTAPRSPARRAAT